jgi:amino acid adenylation domain-containing protein
METAGGFRISSQQRHVWRLAAGTAPVAQAVVRISGPFDPEHLREAWRRTIGRHEILRTTFRRFGGMALPVQVVSGPDEPVPEITEVSGRDLDEIAAADRLSPWDLENGPVLRLSLMRSAPEEHALIVSLFSLCGDSASLDLLAGELAEMYAAVVSGEEPPPFTGMQYVDFAAWQAQNADGEEAAEAKAFWRGVDPAGLTARLPFEEAEPAETGDREPAALSMNLPAAQIDAFCAAQDTSPDLFLLTSWLVLLRRLAGFDPVVGVELDGRPYAEIAASCGLFASSPPVRPALDPGAGFDQALAAVAAAVGEAYVHQGHFAWADLAAEDAAEPGPPCAFRFDSLPEPRQVGPVTFAIERKHACSEAPRIELAILQGRGSLTAELRFDSRRIRPEAAERLAEELATLITGVLAAPAAPLADLEIVGPEERSLLAGLSGGPFPSDETLVLQRIVEQARRTPDAIAVEAQARTLTYGRLDQESNRLARRLRTLGVGPEVKVALFLDRSPEMLVSLLAVLKAGGAYVPLDPTYPAERLAFVLADTGAPVVLTRERLALTLPETGARLLRLDTNGQEIALESAEPLTPSGGAENLAYVIYTSGSTGRPKGVQVTHRNLAASTAARLAWYPEPVSRYLLASSFAFDSSVAGIFWTLCQGGALVLPPDDYQQDLLTFVYLVETAAVSHLLCLPGLHRVLLEQGEPRRLASLRTVIVAGEACPRELVALHHERLPAARLVNEYGPTEGTVWSSAFDCAVPLPPGLVPIGRPVGGTRIHLLTGSFRVIPAGVVGELFVGGEGVAGGYLRRPDLTAERFLPDPFADRPGQRLYRTGDLARWLPGGDLEFLGRADQQVKIRGFRIELGEIEAVIAASPGVRHAVVMARDAAPEPEAGASAEKRLVAWVVPADGERLSVPELRRAAGHALPEFMVPGAWVLLDELPLTPNGKIDRRALPEPTAGGIEDDPGFAAPRTATEEVLAAIWADILKLDRVGVTANFFELGGNSLVATRLVARLREAFRVQLPQRTLFQKPTIAGLAEELAGLRRIEGAGLPPLRPALVDAAPAPLSFTQERLWFFDQLNPGSNAYNLIYPLALAGSLDRAALAWTLSEIVRRHAVLRTRFVTRGNEPVQVVEPATPVPVDVVDLAGLPDEVREQEAERLAVRLQALPFDLTRGPLLRASLLRLGPAEHLLLIAIHQIVFDGWSLALLIRELGSLYRAAVEGRPSPLPELPVQYADFARWQRDWLRGEVVKAQLAYWRNHLGERPRVVEIPSSRPRPSAESPLEQCWLELPPEVASGLGRLGRRLGVTPFMTLLAVLQTLLQRYTGQDRVTVGTLLANRNQPGIEGMIGFFINTLALATDLSGKPPFDHLLERVREVVLGANDHQDLPFERLIEALNPERTSGGQALFQSMLVLNEPLPRLDLPGLTVSFPRLGQGERTAVMDLSFTAAESATGLTLLLNYNRDLFERPMMERLMGHLEALLRGALEDPERHLGSLPLLAEEEIEQIRQAAAGPARAAAVEEEDVREKATVLRAEVTDLREKLSSKKQALLAQRLRRGTPATTRQRIPRRRGTGPARLSFSQERLWFLAQLEPEAVAYSLLEVARLSGEVSIAVFAAALREVLRRHDALRTVCAEIDGVPVQVVTAGPDHSLCVVDLATLPAGRREAAAVEVAEASFRRPFDLAAGPLVRVALARLDEQAHLLAVAMHHIISDAWSTGVLIRELATLYRAFRAGEPSPLPELEIQYADFAEWQRDSLTGEALDVQLGYWKRQLTGAPFILELPADRPRPAVQSFRGRRFSRLLAPGLGEELEAFGRRREATLFMVVLAAFQAFLWRLSGQPDLLVGTPIANRTRVETEGLIGFFVNSLVLRGDCARNPGLAEMVARARETTLAAYAHQDLPFERLVKELQPERSLAYTPLFQVVLVLQNTPGGPIELPGLVLEQVPLVGSTAKFDLHLLLTQTPEGLAGSWEYNSDLFDGTTIHRAAGQFERLLRGALAAPECPLADLPLLAPEEWQQTVVEWNDTARPDAPVHTLHELFLAQAARTPDAEAVAFEGAALTYAELAFQSAALARRLRALGCGPETRVGVALERSLELIVALYGVLRAGAAYVPLDLEYPAERLAHMLEDARPAVLLTREELRPLLPAIGPSTHVLCLDLADRGEEAAVQGGGELEEEGGQLAYVIFTSGSTGRPKGAMVHHAAIVNRLLWMQDAYGLTNADTVLQKTPFSFDVSVWELFWPLLTGARLVVARPGGHRDSGYLLEVIERERVTVLHFVPSMLQVFLEEPDLSACRSLRLVVASGEALPPDLERRFAHRFGAGGPRLENLYGPTEAAVDVTSWPSVRGGEGLSGCSVPIGRPIANTQIRLLDPSLQPVLPGGPGELCIGGVNVGRGYLGQPSMTARKFIPDPFTGPGTRLYRTGDLARWRTDGALEYLGRIDHQVKLRGFRIELGEIEAVLAAQEGIREAVVVVRGEGFGRRLAAYLVPEAGAQVEVSAVEELSRASLPEHMVPRSWAVLPALPLTPSGKVDRLALPDPDAPIAGAAAVPPRTALERELVAIWAEVLRREDLGIFDNFFALGGDSILSIQVTTRARRRGIPLAPRQIFQHQTIAELAAVVERAGDDGENGRGEPSRPWSAAGLAPDELERWLVLWSADGEVEDAFELSPMQQGMLFHTLFSPGAGVYSEQLVFTLEGALDPAALEWAWARLVERHAMLRTDFVWGDLVRPLQRVRRRVEVPWRWLDWSGLTAEAQEERLLALLAEDRSRAYDLGRAPMLRLALARCGERLHRFFFGFHHILMDGWSLPVLFRELFAFYEAEAGGSPAELPPPTPFRDYIAWLQRQDATRAEHFWRRELAGFTAPTPLPADRGPGGELVPAEVRHLLRQETTQALEALARAHRITINTVLQGAWALLLAQAAGEPEVVFGTAVSGRSAALPDIETMIGVFLNVLPVRVLVPSDAPVMVWLRELQERQAETRQFEHVALAQVQEWCELLRGLPLFESLVVFENFPVDDSVRGGGAGVTLGEVRYNDTNNYPLTLFGVPGERLSVSLAYDASRFEASAIERVLGHLLVLLEGMLANPEARLGDLPKLTGTGGAELAARRHWTLPVLEQGVPRGSANPVEEGLVEICAEVLGKPGIGIESNFFQAGGNSLSALLLIARVRQRFQVDLPLPRVFAVRTLAGLAADILERQAEREDQDSLAALLSQLDDLSDDEARRLLGDGVQ